MISRRFLELFLNRQLIDVRDQGSKSKVSVFARFKGTSSVKQVNDREVIEVKCVLSDHQRSRLEQQNGDGNMSRLLETRGAVNVGRFVQITRDAL